MILCLLLLALFGGWGVMFFFCYAALCVLSGFPIISMGKRELVALLKLSGCYCYFTYYSWCHGLVCSV